MRSVLTILLCALSISASAQYKIYTATGDVKVKHTTWQKAKKGTEVLLSDSICIAKGAHVQILNQQTSQLFESTGEGVYTIVKFIANARKQSGRVIAELNKEMAQNVRSDSNRPVTFVGASTRGDMEQFTDSLHAVVLSDFAQVESLSNDFIVSTKRKGKSFYLTIDNRSDKGYFVNMLIVNKQTGERTCAFLSDSYQSELSCLFVPAGLSLALNQFQFIVSKDFEYIVWATIQPFDTNHLQNLLSTSAAANTADLNGIKVWKQKILKP